MALYFASHSFKVVILKFMKQNGTCSDFQNVNFKKTSFHFQNIFQLSQQCLRTPHHWKLLIITNAKCISNSNKPGLKILICWAKNIIAVKMTKHQIEHRYFYNGFSSVSIRSQYCTAVTKTVPYPLWRDQMAPKMWAY